LMFTYKGECIYKAHAGTTRLPNKGNHKYPYYFIVDPGSIEPIQGTLQELQEKLEQAGLDGIPNLVKSRKWPRFHDSDLAAEIVDEYVSTPQDNSKIEQGVGFGDPETNPKVEQSAVKFVTSRHKNQGWTVVSVEAQKIGYDLLCTKGAAKKHVEVKGVQGDEVCFLLTANEKARAEKDKLFCVCIVTRALTASPKCVEITGPCLLADYEFRPVTYRVTKK
jgi:hypothetical protein